VSKLAFSPGGAVLVGTAGPHLRVWDVEAGREVAAHQRGTKHVQGLAFTAGGRCLVTVSNDETVRVWESQSWQEHRTYTWGIGKLLNIALDPGGFRAAAGSDRGQVVIWDLDDL
jgi:WD40 repeat protein